MTISQTHCAQCGAQLLGPSHYVEVEINDRVYATCNRSCKRALLDLRYEAEDAFSRTESKAQEHYDDTVAGAEVALKERRSEIEAECRKKARL